jgi:hypothetical protein
MFIIIVIVIIIIIIIIIIIVVVVVLYNYWEPEKYPKCVAGTKIWDPLFWHIIIQTLSTLSMLPSSRRRHDTVMCVAVFTCLKAKEEIFLFLRSEWWSCFYHIYVYILSSVSVQQMKCIIFQNNLIFKI